MLDSILDFLSFLESMNEEHFKCIDTYGT